MAESTLPSWHIEDGFIFLNGRRMLNTPHHELEKYIEIKPGQKSHEIWVMFTKYYVTFKDEYEDVNMRDVVLLGVCFCEDNI